MAEVASGPGLAPAVPTTHADTPRPPVQVKEAKESKEGGQASTFEQLEQDFQEVRVFRPAPAAAVGGPAARTRVSSGTLGL
jgi:hypothetical protein